ncbi:MAG: hypothetical protein SGBAC_010015 [Bacillariaceae sp.]
MSNSGAKEEPARQEDAVPDLEAPASVARASSGAVFSEEDVVASVVANNSFVPAVVISEKEDPNGDPMILAHQIDDGDDSQPQAPARQQSQRPPSAAAATEQTSTTNNNFASNTAPEESGLNAKMMAIKDARNENIANTAEGGLVNDTVPQANKRKNSKGMMFGICLCLMAVIGIIVGLAVGLSGNDEETRDAAFLTNSRLTEEPSVTATTPVPTGSPTVVATPLPTGSTPSPTFRPTDPPTTEYRMCLQGSDACEDGKDLFGFGADWKSLSCVADLSELKCTIVACNEVFPISTLFRYLHLVSETTTQRIELDSDAFELFNGEDAVFLGSYTNESETEVDIAVPVSYFPNLEVLQVWLESTIPLTLPLPLSFDPVDRLPNQINLGFSPC